MRSTFPSGPRTTRPKSAPIVSVRSKVSTAAAAPAFARAAARSARLAGSVRGWSPFMTTTSPANPARALRAVRAASPVPSGSACVTASTPSGRMARTSSLSAPTTTIVRSGASAATAASPHASTGRPHAVCSSFGVADFIRVPRPPARITHASGEVVMSVLLGGRCSKLGRLDSNQGSRDQNPLPYHLATPHRAGCRAERVYRSAGRRGLVDGVLDLLGRDAEIAQDAGAGAAVAAHERDQDVARLGLAAAALLRHLLGQLEDARGPRRQSRPAHGRNGRAHGSGPLAHLAGVNANRRQRRPCDAAVGEQGQQQVLGTDVVGAEGAGLLPGAVDHPRSATCACGRRASRARGARAATSPR